MTPPCHVFGPNALEAQIQFDAEGRKRKTQGGADIDLAQCPLFGMVQYECQIDRPNLRDSPVRCWPVQRWFRRCQDRKGTFMVETTNWEDRQHTDTASASIPSNGASTAATGSTETAGQKRHVWHERDLKPQGEYHEA